MQHNIDLEITSWVNECKQSKLRNYFGLQMFYSILGYYLQDFSYLATYENQRKTYDTIETGGRLRKSLL